MAQLRSEEELEALLTEAAARVSVGSLYEHYKNGKSYLVTGLAIMRYTGKVCVEYQAQYGKQLHYVRTIDEWFLPGDNGELRFGKR